MRTLRWKNRRRLAAMAALLCALVVSQAVVVTSAAAEEGDSAPPRPVSEHGFSWPEITSVAGFEEYPFEMSLGPELSLRQVGEREIVVEYTAEGVESFAIKAPLEHDADGANVPPRSCFRRLMW